MFYTVPLHLIEDIHSRMKTLLSESNYQQQDLNTIKDDLGALKFGFANVQHTTTELSADSVTQNYKLQHIDDRLDAQDDQIDGLYRYIDNCFTEVTMKLDNIIGSIDMCSVPTQETEMPTTQETETPEPQ